MKIQTAAHSSENQPYVMSQRALLRIRVFYLWNGQPLRLLRCLLGVGAGVCVSRDARPMQRLQADLRAEEVPDGLQGGAGVGGQRRVGQQVGDQTVGLSHHRDVHHHAGAR